MGVPLSNAKDLVFLSKRSWYIYVIVQLSDGLGLPGA